MIKKIKNYLINQDFKINICNNQINIVNYDDIVSIENDRISIISDNKIIIIKGYNMTLCKLLDDEILIKGEIKNINWSE